MMQCPRCKGNGIIKSVEIKSIAYKGYICDECYCMWDNEKDLNVISLFFFEEFVNKKGIPEDFSVFDKYENY